MKPNRPSLDGFQPRRPVNQASFDARRRAPAARGTTGLQRASGRVVARDAALPRPMMSTGAQGVSRQDLTDSLRGIEDAPQQPKKHISRRRGDKKPQTKTRRIIKWIVIILVIAVLSVGGWFAYKVLHAGGNIFKSGNILSLFQSQPLKEDANGRSNILILGTAEDDPGHDAGNLTDSIQIISIDQKNKTAAMFSVPRDLEVQYGMACPSGYSGKINVYFSCVNTGTDAASEQDRLAKTQKFIGDIYGLDIQYGVHVNYTVMRDLVKAVGNSITVDIQGSNGDPGVMDSNFDWKCWNGAKYYPGAAVVKKNCPPNGHFIDYPNGPATLDAEHALYLAQARGDVMPTYGLSNSNFDREANQRKIMLAIKEKALSTGTLTDIGKVTGIIDAMSNNLRTNFDASEIRTLMQLGQDIKPDQITTINLFDRDHGTAVFNANAQPVAGMYNYSGIRAFIAKQLSANPVAREGANVVVLNGSGVAGVAQSEADKLGKQDITVSKVGNAPAGNYGKAVIYQVGTGMPATKAKLEQLYGTTISTATPPVSVTADTNFVVIIGQAPSDSSQSTSGQ